MKKNLFLILCALMAFGSVSAQDTTQAIKQSNNQALKHSDTQTIKLYGFVRNYFNFDSRKTYTVIGGEYNMIPYDEKWNEDRSEDLNAVPHAQLQALTARFGIDVKGPQLGKWSSSGKIEGDFGGFGTTNSVLRLRLAYVKLESQYSKFKIHF